MFAFSSFRKVIAPAVLAAFFGFASESEATVILDIDGSGELTGARNVDLGALGLFDVEFLDGSCNSLFNNCDPDNFAFDNFDDAESAAGALLAQVFVSDFDTNPTLTRGCSFFAACQFIIPFALSGPSSVFSASFSNTSLAQTGLPSGGAGINGRAFDLDTTSAGSQAWARFSAPDSTNDNPIRVFEPGSFGLLGIGLAGLALTRRRRRP